jgi:hypothetical protein
MPKYDKKFNQEFYLIFFFLVGIQILAMLLVSWWY